MEQEVVLILSNAVVNVLNELPLWFSAAILLPIGGFFVCQWQGKLL